MRNRAASTADYWVIVPAATPRVHLRFDGFAGDTVVRVVPGRTIVVPLAAARPR